MTRESTHPLTSMYSFRVREWLVEPVEPTTGTIAFVVQASRLHILYVAMRACND